MADLEIEIEEKIMIATLNRPEKKNALSEEMLKLLVNALTNANDKPDIHCFVITGSGDAFCSGGDLGRRAQETISPTPLERRTRLEKITHQLAFAIERFEKPLIAAINGVAVGAGMDLALSCDIRLGSSNARFSEGYIKVGLLPGNGGCYFLPRLIGTARALELLWTGDFVESDEALSLGLVNHIYPSEVFMKNVLSFATKISNGPSLQISDIKKLTYQSLKTDLKTSLNSVAGHMAVIQSTHDYQEAITAFKEKRVPKFKGY